MEGKTKVVLAVGAGYLLGRTKNLKLAITVGSLLAGQRIRANPQALLKQASNLVQNNPQLSALQTEIRGRMVDAAKGAALSMATSRVEKLTETLRTRGEKKPAGSETEEQGETQPASEEAATEPEDTAEQAGEEGEEEPQDQYEEAGEEGEEEPQDQYEEAGEEGEEQPQDEYEEAGEEGEEQPQDQYEESAEEGEEEPEEAPPVKKAPAKKAGTAKKVPAKTASASGDRAGR